MTFWGVRSDFGVFFRTGSDFLGWPFGIWGVFPDGGILFGESVRDLGRFSERGVTFWGVRSDFGVFFRTEGDFFWSPFGFWGIFPDGGILFGESVLVLGHFPERGVTFLGDRSGFGVFFRTESDFCGSPFGIRGISPDGK